MRKIYRYNRPMGYVKLPLVSPGNVRAFAQFDSGNPMTGECPTFATSDKFWQMVMEENYVSRGVVSLIQTIPEEGDEVQETKLRRGRLKNVDSVDTLEKAVDYLANNHNLQVKTKTEACIEARKLGISFPNLQ